MTTIFGDSEELPMVDYMPSKKTIIGQCCAEIMFKLYDAINQKRRGKLSLSVWLFTTMRQFISHLLHSELLATVDFFN